MTNVEKFKEIFDIEVVPENTCLSESCLCHECSHHDGTRCRVEDWWYAEYQGEPTIPLSVIEKIKAEIERKRDRIKEVEPQNVTASMSGFVLACSEALAIIDKAVKEISDESTRSKDAI